MKLHLNTCLWSAVATVAMAAGANAQSVFTDNFDTYALGSAIHGQNGWHEWDGVQHPGVISAKRCGRGDKLPAGATTHV